MGPLGPLYRSTLSATLLFLLLPGLPGRATQSAEQSSFTEAGALQNPAALTPDVLKLLLDTDAAKEGLSFASAAQRANPAQLFRAAEVHLNQLSEQADLVVIGVCPLCGADTGWFWIVTSAAHNPRVILAAGGKTLEVLSGSNKGYRDIQSVWSSPSQTDTILYRFNGAQYELHKRKSVKNAAH
jgi:hypothetical protein